MEILPETSSCSPAEKEREREIDRDGNGDEGVLLRTPPSLLPLCFFRESPRGSDTLTVKSPKEKP